MRAILVFAISLTTICKAQTKKDSVKIGTHRNKIDEISNIKEFKSFIKSVDKKYSDFKINDSLTYTDSACKRLFDSLHVKTLVKADLDNNGYTDLIVVGNWHGHCILCVFDKGGNKFFINR
ncbi:MAG TPA: hypothetical protein VGG71_00140, partial [Chitinophagaceae bacterium]